MPDERSGGAFKPRTGMARGRRAVVAAEITNGCNAQKADFAKQCNRTRADFYQSGPRSVTSLLI